MHRRNVTRPLLRFAALAVLATTVTTGIVNRRDVPDPPQAKVSPPRILQAQATPPGYDTLQDISGAEMVGLTYTVPSGQSDPTIEVRGQRDGEWTEWLDISAESADGPDADSNEFHPGVRSTPPAWLGRDQQQVEVRVASGTAVNLQLHAVDSEPTQATGNALAIPAADAFVPVGQVTPRAQWGADEASSYAAPGCEGGPRYAPGGVRNALIHHTVNANSYAPSDSAALVRGIQRYHIETNGWCDIGYNFLVDRFGQVFEGRKGGTGRAVIGAHASGFNTGSTGIALIGDFRASGVPDTAYSALADLLTWKLAYHGLPADDQIWVRVGANEGAYWPEGTAITIPRISAHRDVNSTECPGDFLYDLLGSLRAAVAAALANQQREQRIMCDWDGNGTDTPGIFFNGSWAIRNDNTEGLAQSWFVYGDPGDYALCGDWFNSGHDSPAVYRGGRLYMRAAVNSGDADSVAWFGNPGDLPVAGDWNGDGYDTIALVRGDRWYITNSYLPTGTLVLLYGNPGDVPVAGDWTHKGYDSPGIARRGQYVLSDSPTSGSADHAIMFGEPTDLPIVGDFDANGTDTPGLNRGVYWWLLNSLGANATITSFLF